MPYRCDEAFCVWMPVLPESLPYLFPTLQTHVLREVRLTDIRTDRGEQVDERLEMRIIGDISQKYEKLR